MSIDRLQSVPGQIRLSPENTTTGFPGGVSFGGQSGHVEGSAAATGGALFTTGATTSGAIPTIAASGTISHNGCGFVPLTTGGVTGSVVLQPGTRHGQHLVITNASANAITFAAAGTSNVINGASASFPAVSALLLIWKALDSRWYDVG